MPKRLLNIIGFIAGLFIDKNDPATPTEAQTGITTNVEVTPRNTVRLIKKALRLTYNTVLIPTTGSVRWIKNIFLDKVPEMLEYRENSYLQFFVIEDIHSSNNKTPALSITAPLFRPVMNGAGFNIDKNKLTGAVSNLAVHIGTGSEQDNKPIWIGKYQKMHFGKELPASIQTNYNAEHAECKPLDEVSDFPAMHKVVKSGDNYFGIAFNGERIYQFDDEDLVATSQGSLGLLTAICNDPDDDFIWVYEQGNHVLLRINVNTMTVAATLSIDNANMFADGTSLTDIEINDAYIFMALTNPTTHLAHPERFIYSVNHSTTSGNASTTDWSFAIEPRDTSVSGNEPQDGNDKMHYWPIKKLIDDFGALIAKSIWTNKDEITVTTAPITCALKVPPICLTQITPNGIGLIAIPVFSGTYRITHNTTITAILELENEPGFWVAPENGGDSVFGTTIIALLTHDGGDLEYREDGPGTALKRTHTLVLNPHNWDDGGFPEEAIAFNEIGDTTNAVHSIQQLGTNVHIGHNKTWGTPGTQNTKFALADLDPETTDYVYPESDVIRGEEIVASTFMIIEYQGRTQLRHYIEDNNDVFMWAGTGDSPLFLKGEYNSTDDNVVDFEELGGGMSVGLEIIPTGGYGDDTVMDTAYYRFSLIYDGVAESALSRRSSIQIANDEGVRITAYLNDESISKRCTHLNIYRAFSLGGTAELGFYRMVASLQLSEPWEFDDGYYKVTYDDRLSPARLGPTYESSAGLPETLKNTLPNYGLSALINDRLYIADCWHPDIEDARLFLFRSNRFAVDIFNWPEENIRLPETPVAMEEFSNRLFVFTKSGCMVINPEAMHTERVFDGIGALGPNTVAKTPSGLYVAGRSHAYLFTGADRQVLSTPIESAMQDKYDFNWARYARGSNHSVAYHEERQEVLFSANISMTNGDLDGTLVFAWDIRNQRWRREYHVDMQWGITRPTANGEVAIAVSNGIHWPYASNQDVEETRVDNFNKTHSVYSRDIDFGDMLNHKWVYAIKVWASNKDFEVFMNDVPIEKGITTEPMFYFKMPEQMRKQRSVRLRIRLKGAEVGKMSIIYRLKEIYAGQDF